jgi:hypothetical protein
MINENKKRDASPNDHLGRPGIGRRIMDKECDGREYLIARMNGDDKLIAAKKAVASLDSLDNAKRPRGRPKSTETKPWEIEGVSRMTWYRRKKEGK